VLNVTQSEFCNIRDLSDKLLCSEKYSYFSDIAFADAVAKLLRVPAYALVYPDEPWKLTVVASVEDYVAEKRFSAEPFNLRNPETYE